MNKRIQNIIILLENYDYELTEEEIDKIDSIINIAIDRKN